MAREVFPLIRSGGEIRGAVTSMCDDEPNCRAEKGRVGVKGRVLVVDDDLALAEMLGIVLRNEGLEVAHVADGTSAVTAFRESRPDLVLLDVMLPGMDGLEVCRRIRAESGVPIVMLTARTDTLDVVVGLESGADDYVVKPFKPQELIARVRARLRRDNEPEPEVFPIDPTLEQGQRESLAAYKANRDHELVKARLQDVADAARGTQNLLYPMKEALRADATLGEVSDALRDVFGVYQPGR